MLDDTIAAIATAIGEAGLAIVRLSGPQALAIADRCFRPGTSRGCLPSAAATHTLHYGRILQNGIVVDEVLLAVLRAPRTFTGQDTVEITCHGGFLPAKTVLEAVLEHGARAAQPGEFTRRAFLNGRMDLAQAEAVADLIHSRTELALRAANEQLAGKLSQRIEHVRNELLRILAHVEAHIDFPDEDIAPDTQDQLQRGLERSIKNIEQLLRTANEGRILRRGIRVAIAGRPNAGKSSLLNQLLGHNRAIVSSTPGTTRDTIEETANIRGLPVVFIDTAGLRDTRDEVEIEGVRRSRQTLEQAELILHILDVSEPETAADEHHLAEFRDRKRVLILNKIDLPRRLDPALIAAASQSPANLPSGCRVAEVSCLTGHGIEPLKDTIRNLVWSGDVSRETLEVAINSRHQDALHRAQTASRLCLNALRAGQPLELAAVDLRIAADAAGEIIGKTVANDLLDVIFSQFCIGK